MPRKDCFAVVAAFLVLLGLTSVPILLSPLGDYPVVDAAWHNAWSNAIAGGDIFVYAPYFRAPLYPMTLGLVYFFTGSSLLSGILLSMTFSVFSVHLVHRIAFDRAGRIPSLVAASVWILNGVNLFYSSTLLMTPMYIFLLLMSFHLLDREKPMRSGWLFLGLAAVTRPGALLLFPLALVLYRKSWKSFWIMLIPVVLVWAVNWSHGDRAVVISSQGGINFYIGSGPEADGFTAFAPPGEGVPADSLPYMDNVWAASYAPFEGDVQPSGVSAWWVRKTIEHITQYPLNFLELTCKKLLYLVSPVAIPCNYDMYYYGRYSPVLMVLAGTPQVPVSGLLIWFLIPGALLAGPLSNRERNILLWAAVLAAGLLPFFVTARFTLPAIPFIEVLLALRFLKKIKKSLALAPAGVAAGLCLALITGDTVENGGVNMPFHDGVAHFQCGEVAGAEILLLEAVEIAYGRDDGIDLNGVDALYNLGIICIRRGDTEAARMYWERALERNPGYEPAVEALKGLTL
jgi:hypothetical protein